MSTTTNTGLNQPAYNSTSPTWDQPLNFNEKILDAVLGNTTSVAMPTGASATTTLTGPTSTGSLGQTQAMRITLTGTLSANQILQFPSGIAGKWIIYNTTSGSFSVTISSAGGGASVTAPQGFNVSVYSDGTNIRYTDDGALNNNVSNSTATATGTTTARTIANLFGDYISVKDFGAVGDGATDDTAAMQAAHNSGKLIYYPAGYYNFTSISMTHGGGIVGDGPQLTQFFVNTASSTTGNSISYVSPTTELCGPLFRDFSIYVNGGTPKTAGAFLYVQGNDSASFTSGLYVENVYFYQGGYNHLRLINQVNYFITGCTFQNYSNWGLSLDNPGNTDAGDGTITSCFFNTARTGATIGFVLGGAGGTRFVNNKILGGNYSIDVFLTHNTNSADLFIQNNSLELAQIACININRASGATAAIGPIQIQDNEFGGPFGILSNPSASFIEGMLITGNVITNQANTSYHIYLNYIDNLNIVGNLFDLGSGYTIVSAIYIGANCTYGQIKSNQYRRMTTPIINYSTTVIVNEQIQSGTANVNVTTGYGSLYAGSVSVTFPVPFSSAPTVRATLHDVTGLGGVSVSVSNVSATGFTGFAVGVTNSVTLPFYWEANGVICV